MLASLIPLPRQNLKTFKDAMKTKKIKVNGKEHILKTDRKIFGRLYVKAQSRALNMREILKYPLGPLPWSLACTDGTLAKTNKAKLAEVLEKVQSQQWMIQNVLHGLSMVWLCYKFPKTFAELSDRTLNNLLHVAKNAVRIDFVCDFISSCINKECRKMSASKRWHSYCKEYYWKTESTSTMEEISVCW